MTRKNHPVHDRAHPPLNFESRPRDGGERMGFLRHKRNKKHEQREEHMKDPRRRRETVTEANLQRKSPYEP